MHFSMAVLQELPYPAKLVTSGAFQSTETVPALAFMVQLRHPLPGPAVQLATLMWWRSSLGDTPLGVV